MNTHPTERTVLDQLFADTTSLITQALQALFGDQVHAVFIGSVTWADLGVILVFMLGSLLATMAAAAFVRHRTRQAASAEDKGLRHHVYAAVGRPLYVLIWIYGLYAAATPLLLRLPDNRGTDFINALFDRLLDLGVFAVVFWLFFRFTRVLEVKLGHWVQATGSKIDDLFVPLLGKSLRTIVPVVGVIFAIPLLGLPPQYNGIVTKGTSFLLIIAVATILFQAVHLGERAVLTRFDITAADNLRARKVYTQVHVISKTLYVIIGLFTVASVLMLFEEVRRFGASMLASAGVVGIIAGFAAQKTIANLFAGFQIAMTQPIRLDDVVIVEGEWGRVEEITLTYVVIHIWDDRRLVVPLGYFIDKPFQNWTRASAQLLGSVFMWVDYSMPVDRLRAALKQIIEPHPLWDKRFWNVQVTDTTERSMQIRVLATTADSSKGWDLRCDIREKLIAFVQQNHPGSLPQLRLHESGAGPRLDASRVPAH